MLRFAAPALACCSGVPGRLAAEYRGPPPRHPPLALARLRPHRFPHGGAGFSFIDVRRWARPSAAALASLPARAGRGRPSRAASLNSGGGKPERAGRAFSPPAAHCRGG